MNSIQLSFEIATSISIMGAALVFLWGQIGQSKKVRTLAIRQQRIEQMSILIADFALILDAGDVLIEEAAHKRKANVDLDFTDKYIFFLQKSRTLHTHSQ